MFGIGQDLSKIPNDVLQQAVLGSVPTIQPASALGELNSRVKQAQMSQMAMGQQAMKQNAAMGGEPPIAAQVMEQARGLDRGIGALPEAQGVNYAGGGLVSFEGGGTTRYYPGLIPQEGEALLPATTGYEGMGIAEIGRAHV